MEVYFYSTFISTRTFLYGNSFICPSCLTSTFEITSESCTGKNCIFLISIYKFLSKRMLMWLCNILEVLKLNKRNFKVQENSFLLWIKFFYSENTISIKGLWRIYFIFPLLRNGKFYCKGPDSQYFRLFGSQDFNSTT